MKSKVLIFLVVSLGALAVLPSWNLFQSKSKNPFAVDLYSLDVLTSFASRYLYQAGISISPENVVIGKEGWLFLGDNKRQLLTTKRGGRSDYSTAVANDFARWVGAWQAHLVDIPLYVLIGPDKATIYPEFLPDWAVPAKTTILSMIEDKRLESIIIPEDSLLDYKNEDGMDLYLKTDTHWNSLGSWIAYQALAREMSRYQTLAFLGPGHINTMKVVRRNGGDLSRYLHLKDELQDTSIAIDFDVDLKANPEIFDFETGVLLNQGRKYKAQAPEEPTLFRSDNALNAKKVLWMRDSFGNALDPLMAMTFRESLQMDYRRVTPELFARLVARYRPDMVMLTVVERNLDWGTFRKLPEPLQLSHRFTLQR